MNPVPVGPSTLAIITAAVGAVAAFITEWSATGNAPAWLAILAAALIAVLGVLRSWQAVNSGEAVDVADEGPVLPDDVPAEDVLEGV